MSAGARRGSRLSSESAESLADNVRDLLVEAKPRLRGWLHAVTAPMTLAAGVVLILLSPSAAARTGSAVFAASALVLFSVSAVYHRGTWSPRAWAFLRHLDHANIFLLIAGTYTPFTLLLLEGRRQAVLLAVVWAGAVLGVALRAFAVEGPRWLNTAVYFLLGWPAVFFLPDLARGGGVLVLTLIVVGGALYTAGGLVYGARRPDPWPAWFGFHEVFHALTVVAFVAHYAGVSIATYSLR
jgi:hemolysin III